MGRQSNGDVVPAVQPEYDDQGFMIQFQPVATDVPCCGDIIWSTWQGQFEQCVCGESFVDQTKYYSRCGGALAQQAIDRENVRRALRDAQVDIGGD